jgi:hypothetical protein
MKNCNISNAKVLASRHNINTSSVLRVRRWNGGGWEFLAFITASINEEVLMGCHIAKASLCDPVQINLDVTAEL